MARADLPEPRSGFGARPSWIRLRSGPDRRLRRATKVSWKQGKSGLLERKDLYSMKPKVSRKEAALFEKQGIRFRRGYRPYSHKVSGHAREGFLKEPKTVHGIERGKVPGRILGKAAKGKLAGNSRTHRRYFRS